MSERWAVRIARAQAHAVGTLRLRPGLEVCAQETALWLRGEALDPELETALRKLPGADRFAVLTDGHLREIGTRIPRGALPQGPWGTLRNWLRLKLQSASLPAEFPVSTALRIVRAEAEAEARVLVLPFDAWAEYALAAPAIRLRPLSFAAQRGRALVRGAPLPPRPGLRCSERDGIAVPCGFRWDPPVDPPVVCARLGLAPGDLALFATDGSYERIPAAAFVSARRSAVRATREALGRA